MAKKFKPTEEQIVHHRMLVGLNIKTTLEEHHYHLAKIISECDLVYENHITRKQQPIRSDENINFSFNAYLNTLQSIKDSLQTAVGQTISWSLFSNVKHISFMKLSRNAVTHDGTRLINAYADG